MSNKIIFLLNNPQSAKEMGENGRKRAEKLFDIRKTIEELERLYCESI
jgi:glycosyltransferase involved in cell wall biosynthesis